MSLSAFLGRRWQRRSDIMSPAVLKSISDGTLVVPGISIRVLTTEETCACSSSTRKQDHPDGWWAALTRTDPILHLCSYHQLSCPEVSWHRNNSRDWILFGCSLLLAEVPVLVAVVKNITTWDSCPKSGQIRSKFWPEPDLVGFPKKGRMPEPKSGTSLINSK